MTTHDAAAALADAMTTDTPRPVTIEEVMAATGLGPYQVRADVRAGLLPGRMRGARLVCPRGLWERYLAGDWTPRPQPQPVPMLHKKSA
jgi:hypothetical protein